MSNFLIIHFKLTPSCPLSKLYLAEQSRSIKLSYVHSPTQGFAEKTRDLARRKILIIEDETTKQNLISIILASLEIVISPMQTPTRLH